MDNQFIDKLTQISFPNTVQDSERSFFTKKDNIYFQGIMKGGEMAGIQWIQVWEGSLLKAEIKESVCDLFYN